MISAGKLTPGHAAYFEGEVASGREDYFAGRGEAPGVWKGRGAAAVGLSSEVQDGQLGLLFEMRHPGTGEPMGSSYNVSGMYIDRFGNEQVRHKRAAFDATFSVPKSVSELIAVSEPGLQARLLAGVSAGNDAAMAHLDTHAAFSRVGKGGARQVDTEGLVMASYLHRTSRAGDPQFHFHNLISNRVLCGDGKWRALDGRNLFPELKTAGMVGQAAMRAELSKLGVEWGPVSEHGQAEVLGVPEALMRLHSKRTRQVEAHATAAITHAEEVLGRALTPTERAEKYDTAAIQTRQVKSRELHAVDGLYDRWRSEAVEAGYDPAAWLVDVFSQSPESSVLSDLELVDRVMGRLTEKKATWGRTDATRELARHTPHHNTNATEMAARIEALTDRALGSEEVVQLTVAPPASVEAGLRADGLSVFERHNSKRYGTVTTLGREQHVLDHVDAGRNARVGVADPEQVAAGIAQRAGDGVSLSVDQEAAVLRITQSGEAVVPLVGPAGAGKSRTLEVIYDAYARSGVPVRGLAPSAKAAAVLRDEAGIVRSDTLAKLLYEHNRPGGPDPAYIISPGEVLVLDEASMATTSDWVQLVDLAKTAGAKIVAVGDYRQLGAVDAGGLFRLIAKDHPAAELDQIWRFTIEWERHASLQLRSGNTTVIDTYQQHDRIKGGTRDQMLDHAFTQWDDHRSSGDSVIVTAGDRATVAEFNARARRHLQHTGHIAAQGVVAGEVEVAVGDEILTLQNDRRLIATDGAHVRNGDRWTIQAHTHDHGLVVEHLDPNNQPGGWLTLPASYLEQGLVDHAYATTVHKAQGVTVDHAYLIVDQQTTAESLYVGATRGRHDNQFLVVTEPEITEFGIETGPQPHPTQLLAEAIRRETSEQSATEILRTELDRPDTLCFASVKLLTEHDLQRHATTLGRAFGDVQKAQAEVHAFGRADGKDQSETDQLKTWQSYDQTNIDRLQRNLAHYKQQRPWKPADLNTRRRNINQTRRELETRYQAVAEINTQIDAIEQRRTRRKTSLAGSDMAENRLTIAKRKLDQHTTTIEPTLARDRAARVESFAKTGVPERVHEALGDRPRRPEHAAVWDTAAGQIDQHNATWPTRSPNSRQLTRLVYDQQAQHISQLTRTYQQAINPPAINHNIARSGPSLGIGR